MHSSIYRETGADNGGAGAGTNPPAPAQPARAVGSEAPAKPSGWHYKPSLHYHTEEAIRHVDSLAGALLVWVGSVRPAKVLDEAGEVDLEELRSQVVNALCAAVEWDGRSVAAQLAEKFSWPSEQTLVDAIHRWSCALHRAKYEKWIADRDLRRARRAARHHA